MSCSLYYWTRRLHTFYMNHFSHGWVQNVPEIHQPQEPGMWRGWPPDPPMEKSGFQCTLCRWAPSTPGMRAFWNTGFTNVAMGNNLLPQTDSRTTTTATTDIEYDADFDSETHQTGACVTSTLLICVPIIYGLLLSQKRSVSQSCKMKTLIWKKTGNVI